MAWPSPCLSSDPARDCRVQDAPAPCRGGDGANGHGGEGRHVPPLPEHGSVSHSSREGRVASHAAHTRRPSRARSAARELPAAGRLAPGREARAGAARTRRRGPAHGAHVWSRTAFLFTCERCAAERTGALGAALVRVRRARSPQIPGRACTRHSPVFAETLVAFSCEARAAISLPLLLLEAFLPLFLLQKRSASCVRVPEGRGCTRGRRAGARPPQSLAGSAGQPPGPVLLPSPSPCHRVSLSSVRSHGPVRWLETGG